MSTPAVTPNPTDDQTQSAPPQGQSTAAAGSPQQPVQTEDQRTDAQVQGQQTPQYAPQPVVVTPAKRGGILGVVDSVMDALTGTQRPEVGHDQQGNPYVKEHTLSRGEQWTRLGAEALQGAAAGLAAGKGAGNMGRAAQAGVQAGVNDAEKQRQNAKDVTAQVRQEKMDQFNDTMLKQKIIENQFALTRMKQQATQADVDFANAQVAQEEKRGSIPLGSYKNIYDLPDLQKEHPEIIKKFMNTKDVVVIPTVGADDQHDGATFYLRRPGVDDEILPPGTPFFHPTLDDKGQYTLSTAKTTAPMRQSEIDALNNAAHVTMGTQQKDLATQAHVEAETRANNATANKAPAEIDELEARAAQARAQTEKIRSGALNPDGEPNPRFESLAQALYTGDLLPADLKREAKGAGLDPNEVMARAVELGKENGRPYSATMIQDQHKAYNAKLQAYLTGIDNMIGTPQNPKGQLDQVLEAAQKAGVSENAPIGTVRRWIQARMGDDAAKTFDSLRSDTQTQLGSLIGNPLLGGGESDKKLAQAQKQYGQDATLSNLKAANEQVREVLQRAQKNYANQNIFVAKRYGMLPGAPQTGAAQPVTMQPGEPTARAADGGLLVVRNGQWVPAQHP